MENLREKSEWSKDWEKIEKVNGPVLRQLVQELQEIHSLTPGAIARILHVEERWIEMVLRQTETEGKNDGQE